MSEENRHSNTHLVHVGTPRASNNETLEVLFMTTGFLCENAEQERALIGIKEGYLRISSGLEHKDGLILDILQALSYES